MVESEINKYKLNSEGKQESLKISLIDDEVISMVLTNNVTQQRYSAQFGLLQLQEVCQAFSTVQTILQALNILKNTIESRKIELIEDPNEKLVEVNYNIILDNREYPTFKVNLLLENENEKGGEEDVQILPPTFDYNGDREAEEKYKNTTENTTEYVKPIVQSNVKEPILQLEYIEPIVQVHYPDGTIKSHALPPRIQAVGGKTPNITEEQFKLIQEKMNQSTIQKFSPIKDLVNKNRSSSVIKKNTSIYSTQSTPFPYNLNNLELNQSNNAVSSDIVYANQTQPIQNLTKSTNPINYGRAHSSNINTNNIYNLNSNIINLNKNESQYSLMTMQQRPLVVPNINNISVTPNVTMQNNLNNTGYIQHSNILNQKYNMIERRPRMINKNTNNNKVKDINRSSSQPSQDNFSSFNQNKNGNIIQSNLTKYSFQVNQNKFNFNSQRFPYDRNTQRTTNYNKLNTLPNLHNSFIKTQQSSYYQKTYSHNNTQPLKGINGPNNLSKILPQQDGQRYFSKIEQRYTKIYQKDENQSQQLRQQITIIRQPQAMQRQLLNKQQLSKSQQINQNQTLNNQQLAQTQQLSLNQGITNSLTNNQSFTSFTHQYSHELQQSQTKQNFPFKTQISARNPIQAPSLNESDISQKLISLAEMASMQNEANPNYKNLQTYTLEQQNQESQQDQEEVQEYQPQEEIPKYNGEEQTQEPIQETNKVKNKGNEDIEALFFTEDGRVIFRNGLLRGIIHKYAEIDEVVSKIQDKLLKGVKFNLVYKAFDLGDKAKVFHEKCDNLNMSLILIETDKDVRFGGFTTRDWKGNCLKKNDNNAFVFNLNNNTIFDIIKNQPAIGCYPKFGPVFFGCQIRIYDEFFTKGGTTCLRRLNYKTNKDFELNNGERKYLVKDIEVYSIETIDI